MPEPLNPCAHGLQRAAPLAASAAGKAARLGQRWNERHFNRRRLLLDEIVADLERALSLAKSAQAVARHRREA